MFCAKVRPGHLSLFNQYMFMFRLWSFVGLFIICYAGCKQPGGRQENFNFNPKPDVLYKLSVKRINHQQRTYKDILQQVVDSSEIDYSFQLLHKTDSAFLLRLVFDNFRIHNNMFTVNTGIENINPEALKNNPLLLWNYLLHFAKGQSVTVWMNRKGRPIQVNGIERLVDSVTSLSENDKRTVRSYLKDYISKAAIMDELNQLFCFIPGRTKSVGQSWVENIMLVTKAPVKWSTDFTLQSVKNDTVIINCNSFISAKQGGETGRTYMKGKLTGTIVADYSTGLPWCWNAKSETVSSTDIYDITSRQTLTATITTIRQ
jgi:Family of unknown function (DUF6263)